MTDGRRLYSIAVSNGYVMAHVANINAYSEYEARMIFLSKLQECKIVTQKTNSMLYYFGSEINEYWSALLPPDEITYDDLK